MYPILKRAFMDTKASFNLSIHTIIVNVLVFIAVVGVFYFFEGQEKAKREFMDYVLYLLAFVGVVVVPTFLWNLWLAPYRILEEHLNSELVKMKQGMGFGSSDTRKEPEQAEVSLYQNHKTLSLYEAACLWVEIEPHYPIVNQRAGAQLSLLKGAVRNGELVCAWRSTWTHISDSVNKIKDKTPTDVQEVSMVNLRRYAEKQGTIPLFLRGVGLPVGSPKKKDRNPKTFPR